MKDERRLTIRILQEELDLLEAYCGQVSRTKTDVMRELIRGLSRKVRKMSNC
ncbi:MAG: CopG family transcriptional regulator [Nostoc sp. LLA-1]|nr:CopG family transcriptional regulator [Cyanocohniella sp. LLY]